MLKSGAKTIAPSLSEFQFSTYVEEIGGAFVFESTAYVSSVTCVHQFIVRFFIDVSFGYHLLGPKLQGFHRDGNALEFLLIAVIPRNSCLLSECCLATPFYQRLQTLSSYFFNLRNLLYLICKEIVGIRTLGAVGY